MIRKINIRDLRLGMFIVDVTQSWSRMLNLDKTLYVEDLRIIQLLKDSGYTEIYIDTAKTKKIEPKINQPATKVKKVQSLQQKLENAVELRNKAQRTISNVMSDLQKGNKIVIDEVEEAVEKICNSVYDNQYALTGMVLMQEKNQYLFDHSASTCVLMAAFARYHGFNPEEQKQMAMGALLHDIGMVNLPTRILYKRGELTDEEKKEIQNHVKYGVNILKNTKNVPEIVIKIVAEHHERFDGSGYPFGIKGSEFGIHGQMMSIADVYDAAISDRGYKKAVTPTKAMADILLKSDHQFDGALVNSFIQSIGIYPYGSMVQLNNGLVGVVKKVNTSSLLFPELRIVLNSKNGSMIPPYNLDLEQHKDSAEYKITGLEKKEKFFLEEKDVIKILAV